MRAVKALGEAYDEAKRLRSEAISTFKAREDAIERAEQRLTLVERERDSRPDISAEDADVWIMSRTFGGDPEPQRRVMEALRSHAKKAKVSDV